VADTKTMDIGTILILDPGARQNQSTPGAKANRKRIPINFGDEHGNLEGIVEMSDDTNSLEKGARSRRSSRSRSKSRSGIRSARKAPGKSEAKMGEKGHHKVSDAVARKNWEF
jgi:hypothetical protein